MIDIECFVGHIIGICIYKCYLKMIDIECFVDHIIGICIYKVLS